MTPIRLRIAITFDGREYATDATAEPDTHLVAVVAAALREHGLPIDFGWELAFRGTPVPLKTTAGALAETAGTTDLLDGLTLTHRAVPPEPPPSVSATTTFGEASERSPWRSPGAPAPSLGTMRSRSTAEAHDDDESMDEDDFEDIDDVPARKRRMVTRRATVRYYSRMNPERMFPLLVVLSAEEIEQVVKTAVKQAQSAGFKVEAGSQLVVEPVLPGCDCYPPTETISAEPQPVTATFWVVPRVLGRVQGARVVLRQNGRVLSEVKLSVKVSKQTAAVVFGLLGLFAPYLTMGLKAAKLDFDSQQADGFPVYRTAGAWCVEHARPEYVGFALLGLAVACYLWARPRRREVFWDVTPKAANF